MVGGVKGPGAEELLCFRHIRIWNRIRQAFPPAGSSCPGLCHAQNNKAAATYAKRAPPDALCPPLQPTRLRGHQSFTTRFAVFFTGDLRALATTGITIRVQTSLFTLRPTFL